METNTCVCLNIIVLVVCMAGALHGQDFLSVKGRNLTLHGEKVFLSGMNQAWWAYSNDFGNNGYVTSRPHLLATLDAIQSSGGNSVSKYDGVIHSTAKSSKTPKKPPSAERLTTSIYFHLVGLWKIV